MSYQSGRPIRPTREAQPSTVASATNDTRKLVRRYLPGVNGVTIDSHRSAHPVTFDARIRTIVFFPETVDTADLVGAIENSPDVVSAIPASHSITITRIA